MNKKTDQTYEQEMVAMGRVFLGFLFGMGALLSMWFLSGIYYVILK